MPYRYLDNIAIADVAFEALGSTGEELFISAAAAVMNVMVEDLESIARREVRTLHCEASSYDMLLFRLLGELIYFKDAETLLLRIARVDIAKRDNILYLTAHAEGEEIDPARHELNVDVKAVTLHRLAFEHTDKEWKATVVLDV